MKAFSNPLIFLGLILALATFAYWDEYRTDLEEASKKHADKLVHLAADQLLELRIVKKGTYNFNFKKSAIGWNIVEPIQATADQAKLETIVSKLKLFASIENLN